MRHSKNRRLKSKSTRVDIMCGDTDDLETLRFKRDLAQRDGNMKLALEWAIAIDKKKGFYAKSRS